MPTVAYSDAPHPQFKLFNGLKSMDWNRWIEFLKISLFESFGVRDQLTEMWEWSLIEILCTLWESSRDPRGSWTVHGSLGAFSSIRGVLGQRCQRTSLQIENQNWLIQFEPLPASCCMAQCMRIAFVRFLSISQDCRRFQKIAADYLTFVTFRKGTFALVRLFGMPA